MSAIRARALSVSVSGQRVGSLEINRSGLVSWVPVPEWEAGGQRPRLGVAFLRTPGVRSAGTGLPAWFENLLPETGSALLQRLCAVHGLPDGTRFGLLQAIGGDLSGAVEITAHHAANPSTVVSGPLLVEHWQNVPLLRTLTPPWS